VDDVTPKFVKLNEDWNAEPNAPDPKVRVEGSTVTLEVLANPFQFPRFGEGDIVRISFPGCCRYRLGPTNDEGWYAGQCRFSSVAPAWGKFYEIKGDARLDRSPKDWHVLTEAVDSSRHFLFYLRDETFECEAREVAVEFLQETVTLYRPVGQAELDLIVKNGYRQFPPRLPEQPIFYPVCNLEYAIEITTKWNVKDQGVGYVTRFDVGKAFLASYERKVVGAARHEEYWIPAEELDAFNEAIVGRIQVVGEYRR